MSRFAPSVGKDSVIYLLITALLFSYQFIAYHHVVQSLSLGALSLSLILIYIVIRFIWDNILVRDRIIIYSATPIMSIITFAAFLDREIPWADAINMIVPIIIFFSIYNLSRIGKLKASHRIMYVGFCLVSIIVGLFQAFNLDFAWQLREWLPKTDDEMVNYQIANRLKPPGLSYYSVQLSYQIVALGGVAHAMLLQRKQHDRSGQVLTVLLVSCAIILEQTSAAVALAILGMPYFAKSSMMRRFILISAAILAIGFILSSERGASELLSSTKLSRISFAAVAVLSIAENPLGIPKTEMEQSKYSALQMLAEFDLPLADDIVTTSFHNTFLNIMVRYGFISFLLYLLFYTRLCRISPRKAKQTTFAQHQRVKASRIFSIAYLAQCLTHNAGPLTGDPYFWIAQALILTTPSRLEQQSVLSKRRKSVYKQQEAVA